MTSKVSPFLYPGSKSTVERLSIIHLKRDLQIPTILKDRDEDDEGYTEGKVVNTRFGSFPHSTLIDVPWGTQVRASIVDTGSRGRRVQAQEKKRKREEQEAADNAKKAKLEINATETLSETNASTPTGAKNESEAREAATGFVHLLPPTPETWTSSLPHRTQVVYTPDYSYILHRIRARPGTRLIEAGAGSGSFTHASARAVFNGYPSGEDDAVSESPSRKSGKVWSYEFHEQRHEKLVKEIQDHGLDGVVQITHRDVCSDGFLVDGKSPEANAVFLDLPAPWLALPHLSRSRPTSNSPAKQDSNGENGEDATPEPTPFVSPLNSKSSTYICTFSPCIEQVQKTISVMRQLGWIDIEMVEISAKRFEVRRERIGIDVGDQRGALAVPATVDEAVTRLLEVEGTTKEFHENGDQLEVKKEKPKPNSTKQAILESLVDGKIYKEGKLIHKSELEVKIHTSYLVFAILPMEWSPEDEAAAAEKWPVKPRQVDKVIGMSRKQQKRADQLVRQEKQRAEKKQAGAAEVVEEDQMDTKE